MLLHLLCFALKSIEATSQLDAAVQVDISLLNTLHPSMAEVHVLQKQKSYVHKITLWSLMWEGKASPQGKMGLSFRGLFWLPTEKTGELDFSSQIGSPF